MSISLLGPVPQGGSSIRRCWGIPDEKDGLEDWRGPRKEPRGYRGTNHYRLQGWPQRFETSKYLTSGLFWFDFKHDALHGEERISGGQTYALMLLVNLLFWVIVTLHGQNPLPPLLFWTDDLVILKHSLIHTSMIVIQPSHASAKQPPDHLYMFQIQLKGVLQWVCSQIVKY